MTIKSPAFIGLAAALITAGSLTVGPAHAAGATAPAGDAARGAPLYARNCTSCHGATGAGDGPAARALRPAPTDFTAKPIAVERVFQVTKTGGMAAGLAPTMPGFERMLSDQELRDVSAYVISLHGQSADGGSK